VFLWIYLHFNYHLNIKLKLDAWAFILSLKCVYQIIVFVHVLIVGLIVLCVQIRDVFVENFILNANLLKFQKSFNIFKKTEWYQKTREMKLDDKQLKHFRRLSITWWKLRNLLWRKFKFNMLLFIYQENKEDLFNLLQRNNQIINALVYKCIMIDMIKRNFIN
jgi:hypothetical protein